MILKMITNLFNIFDPATGINYSYNWRRALIVFIVIPYTLWVQPSRYSAAWISIINYLIKEFKILINFSFSNLIMPVSLFIIILSNNFIGLFPYVFTTTRHLRVCLALSITTWIRIILFRITNYFNALCAHLTPQGTPLILMPFMVIIESISLIIRPVTLAVRLTANIIAGHLLITLLGSTGISINSIIRLLVLITTQIILLVLEISVSVIQAYVFSILITLYRREV